MTVVPFVLGAHWARDVREPAHLVALIDLWEAHGILLLARNGWNPTAWVADMHTPVQALARLALLDAAECLRSVELGDGCCDNAEASLSGSRASVAFLCADEFRKRFQERRESMLVTNGKLSKEWIRFLDCANSVKFREAEQALHRPQGEDLDALWTAVFSERARFASSLTIVCDADAFPDGVRDLLRRTAQERSTGSDRLALFLYTVARDPRHRARELREWIEEIDRRAGLRLRRAHVYVSPEIHERVSYVRFGPRGISIPDGVAVFGHRTLELAQTLVTLSRRKCKTYETGFGLESGTHEESW